MRGVLVQRSDEPAPDAGDVPVIRDLTELPAVLLGCDLEGPASAVET